VEATAFLLEKTGDFQGALNLMMEKLEGCLADDVSVDELCHVCSKCIALCQRGSSMLDEKSRQSLWFPLLETLMKPQRKENSANKLGNSISNICYNRF
jgi:hypothetical protein